MKHPLDINATEAKQAEVTVPVIREEFDVSKREVLTGELTLRKRVGLQDVHLELERRDHGYTVERRTAGHLLDEAPAAQVMEGASTVYRVIEEVPVVVTKYRIVEEIVVTPNEKVTTNHTVVPSRQEHVDIIRTPLATETPRTT